MLRIRQRHIFERVDMNRKQKISLLCGIVAVVFGVLNALFDFYSPGFDIYLVTVALITAGCLYNFKDKKGEQAQNNSDIDEL